MKQNFTIISEPNEQSEFGNPHENEVEVRGVVIIGYDADNDTWLGLKWRDNGTVWLSGGGCEENEDYFTAAVRELKEETGFHNYKKAVQLGGIFQAHYYNERKKSYRRGVGYSYLFYVDPLTQQEQLLESHENFDVVWLEYDELRAEIMKTGGGVEHWLEILRRAKLAVQSKAPTQAA